MLAVVGKEKKLNASEVPSYLAAENNQGEIKDASQLLNWVAKWLLLVDGVLGDEHDTQQEGVKIVISKIKDIVTTHNQTKTFWSSNDPAQVKDLKDLLDKITSAEKLAEEYEKTNTAIVAANNKLANLTVAEEKRSMGESQYAAKQQEEKLSQSQKTIDAEEAEIIKLEKELEKRKEALLEKKTKHGKDAAQLAEQQQSLQSNHQNGEHQTAVVTSTASIITDKPAQNNGEIEKAKKELETLKQTRQTLALERAKLVKTMPVTLGQWALLLKKNAEKIPEGHATKKSIDNLLGQILEITDGLESMHLIRPLLDAVIQEERSAKTEAQKKIQELEKKFVQSAGKARSAVTEISDGGGTYAYDRGAAEIYWSSARIKLLEFLTIEILKQPLPQKFKDKYNRMDGSSVLMMSSSSSVEEEADEPDTLLEQYARGLIEETLKPVDVVDKILAAWKLKHGNVSPDKNTLEGKITQAMEPRGPNQTRSLNLAEEDPKLGWTVSNGKYRINSTDELAKKRTRIHRLLSNSSGLMCLRKFAKNYDDKSSKKLVKK